MYLVLYLNREGVEADNAMLQLKSKGFIRIEFISRWSEAVAAIQKGSYDAVLVDINFKVIGLSSSDLFSYLNDEQQLAIVIAVSLSDTIDQEHLESLVCAELLIKPFSASLLEKCLLQVISLSSQRKASTSKVARPVIQDEASGVVFFKGAKGSLERIDFDEISYIQANGILTHFFLNSKVKRTVDSGIRAALSRFNRDDLLQIHKSYAVPLHSIQRVFRAEVVLKDGSRIPVGRSFKDRLKSKLPGY